MGRVARSRLIEPKGRASCRRARRLGIGRRSVRSRKRNGDGRITARPQAAHTHDRARSGIVVAVDTPLPLTPPGAASSATTRATLRDKLARGSDSAWVLPAHVGVLALAAFVYVFNLSVSGYANTFYSMAAQAAASDWSAWFWGSLDPSNFITVDKPPLATMAMGLSVRLFGLSSWSILLPEAIFGVATIAVLYAIVRRTAGPAAATIAALVATLTPAAVLIFRYNNPDALLTLLLVLAAWAFLRALIRRPAALADCGRTAGGSRLQHQVPAGLSGAARLCDRVPVRRTDGAAPAAAGSGRRAPRRARLERVVGAGGSADARRHAPVHRRLDRRHGRAAALRLRRPGAHLR